MCVGIRISVCVSLAFLCLCGPAAPLRFPRAPADRTDYVKALTQNEPAFLSPQQISALSRREQHPGTSAQKADVFSLGITLLEACSLQSSKKCYEYPRCRINWAAVNEQLAKTSQMYSSFLANLIREMIHEDENERIPF